MRIENKDRMASIKKHFSVLDILLQAVVFGTGFATVYCILGFLPGFPIWGVMATALLGGLGMWIEYIYGFDSPRNFGGRYVAVKSTYGYCQPSRSEIKKETQVRYKRKDISAWL